MNFKTKVSLVFLAVLITGCNCDLQWDLSCKPHVGGYDAYRELHQSYEEKRERKIVRGLGGALINPY